LALNRQREIVTKYRDPGSDLLSSVVETVHCARNCFVSQEGLVPERIVRPSGRVVLINREDRVLLFEGGAEQIGEDRPVWVLPGGGAEDGEDVRDTAARELFEETGLQVEPTELIGPVAVSSGGWRFLDTHYWSEDAFFMHRIPEWEVRMDGWSDLEHNLVNEFRWWSLDELRNTEDIVFPWELPRLLELLLAGNIPSEPLVLAWR
jgi:ADP-ribose pyrophosphatase YjhB (NUDIX family)